MWGIIPSTVCVWGRQAETHRSKAPFFALSKAAEDRMSVSFDDWSKLPLSSMSIVPLTYTFRAAGSLTTRRKTWRVTYVCRPLGFLLSEGSDPCKATRDERSMHVVGWCVSSYALARR